ncbi:hypothetical protein D3C81_1654980 [compost metagenome]
MCRTNRQMYHGCRENNCGRADIGCEAINRFNLENFCSHGLNNLPAAHRCPESHRRSCRDFNPQWYVHIVLNTSRYKGEYDDPHSLLRIICTVREGLEGSRNNLSETEAFVYLMRTRFREDPLENPHNDKTR